MERAKTLWILDYGDGHRGRLIPLYAEDEESAWVEAHCWAMRQDIVLPETAILVHFPQGFTIHKQALPGNIGRG